jgi:putative SOS response-associated peptidase YedK
MCGRYLLHNPVDDLRSSFSFTRQRPNLEQHYNIAPMQQVPIVRNLTGRKLTITRQARRVPSASW